MTTGQVLSDSRKKGESDNDEYDSDAIESGGEDQVMSFLHPSIQMSKMPMTGQIPRAQGER